MIVTLAPFLCQWQSRKPAGESLPGSSIPHRQHGYLRQRQQGQGGQEHIAATARFPVLDDQRDDDHINECEGHPLNDPRLEGNMVEIDCNDACEDRVQQCEGGANHPTCVYVGLFAACHGHHIETPKQDNDEKLQAENVETLVIQLPYVELVIG